jgi:hypothetical protein
VAIRGFNIFFHVHLVSDSTGETLITLLKAAAAQFEHAAPVEHMYALVRSPRQMDRVMRDIIESPGIVLFTLVNDDLRRTLEQFCQRQNFPYISVLDPVLALLSDYLGATQTHKMGAQRIFDADYHKRIDAIHYAMAADDGQSLAILEESDVVLVGVSRTSKTPTSVYLANRGIKAANVPLVPGGQQQAMLPQLKKPLIVGLTISPDRLVQIRRNRLAHLHEDRETTYVDMDAIRQELIEAKKLYERNGWPVIDVSRRSVEETAAQIINLLQARTHREAQL